MAFGKKKVTEKLDQATATMRATEALAKRRQAGVQVAIRVRGKAPLLMHRWTKKAVIQMLSKMAGQPLPRGNKDLTADFEDSWYRNTKGEVAIPLRLVKACIVNGAILTDGTVTKADLKRSLRVVGRSAPIRIEGGNAKDKLQMDVRIASNTGSVDLRSRALLPEDYWFDVVLQFAAPLTPDMVMSAFAAAGDCIGLCDWRPENGGEFGTFDIEVLEASQVARIMKENSVPEQDFDIPPELLRAYTVASESEKSDVAKKAMAVVSNVNGQQKEKGARRGEAQAR